MRCLFHTILLPCVALPLLAGCEGVVVGMAESGVSIATIQRTTPDLVVSAVTGRDCSVVRLDRKESYCKPPELPPRLPYCTHSLGKVDCWADPTPPARLGSQVGDAPALTAQQQADREKSWLQRELGF
jgi:hypothetical protein